MSVSSAGALGAAERAPERHPLQARRRVEDGRLDPGARHVAGGEPLRQQTVEILASSRGRPRARPVAAVAISCRSSGWSSRVTGGSAALSPRPVARRPPPSSRVARTSAARVASIRPEAITNGSRSGIDSGATVRSTIETPGPNSIRESYRAPSSSAQNAIRPGRVKGRDHTRPGLTLDGPLIRTSG